MAFRLIPGPDITQSVRDVSTEQLDRALAKLSGKAKKGNAVHETRKSMKRLRALLHLIKPAISKADFQSNETRIKQIAKSLAGVRDIQAMLETVAKLEAYDEKIGQGRVAQALRAHLEEKRDAAEKNLSKSDVGGVRDLLQEARNAFAELTLEKDDFAVLATTIKTDYRKARQTFKRAYEVDEDEAFHDWRKYVQRHWRQLLLVTNAWPDALRPHTDLARDLSEVLGDDHDLYVLAHFVQDDDTKFGNQRSVNAYLNLGRRRQIELRNLGKDLGTRLLAEKPASLADRLTAYWRTAEPLQDHGTMRDSAKEASATP